MFAVFSMKAVRLLLSLTVSLWMAGACLFGCTNKAMGVESEHQVQTVVAHQSCHSKAASNLKQSKDGPSFVPAPRGTMKDCPLVVNATAATSKNSGHEPDPGRAPVSALLLVENTVEQSNTSRVVPFLPNRGQTHLRCCVFLI